MADDAWSLRDIKRYFLFDPGFRNFNHGMYGQFGACFPMAERFLPASFGAFPSPVRDELRKYQDLFERSPDKFFYQEHFQLMKRSRMAISQLLNVPVHELVFVNNATTGTAHTASIPSHRNLTLPFLGVNTVLRNLKYNAGDCILYFETIYGACEKTLQSIAETNRQLHLRRIECELPCTHTEILARLQETISQVLKAGQHPRLCLFETIVSQPGFRFPFESITRICREHGILSLVDGAHGVGQIPLNLAALDADFFVSNCHK
jgi:hercynylcysteine S-oxide lyase